MSETVHFKGKLKPMPRPEGVSLEEQMKDILGISEIKDYYDNVEEQFYDYTYGDFLVLNNTIYEVEKENIFYNDIFESSLNDDDSIDFEVKYYNGGCGFNEAVEMATEKYRKEH